MNEQNPKYAPVEAALSEQDAYGGGGGVTAEPIIAEAVGNASLRAARLEGGKVKGVVVRMEAAELGDKFVGTGGGKSAEGIDPKDTNIERSPLFTRNAFALGKMPSRVTVADSVLIFFTDPDAAEVLIGDLIERTARVRARKSARLTAAWFWWQVFWMVVHQALARIKDKTVLGKLSDAIIKRIGR